MRAFFILTIQCLLLLHMPLFIRCVSFDTLDAIILQGLTCPKTPGAAVAITKGSQILYLNTYGYRDAEQLLPVHRDTLFSIGSTSKAMCSAVAAKLQSDDLFKWGDPVHKLYPSFRYRGDYSGQSVENEFISKRVTLVDLFSHRVGLSDEINWFLMSAFSEPFIRIESYFEYSPLVWNFRTSYDYSNTAYEMGGRVLEKITGRTYPSLLRQHLFDKLGMTSTTTQVKEAVETGNYAIPYATKSNGQWMRLDPSVNIYADNTPCSGGVITSIEEITKWTRMLTRGGLDAQGRVVVPYENLKWTFHGFTPLYGELVDETETFQEPNQPEGWIPTDYAMGWIRSSYRGRDLYFHDGSVFGSGSLVAIMPSENVSVAYLSNQLGISRIVLQVMLASIDLALGYQPWLDPSQVCSFPSFRLLESTTKKTWAMGDEDALEQGDGSCRTIDPWPYVGTYINPGYGSIVVDYSERGLVVLYGNVSRTVCTCVKQESEHVLLADCISHGFFKSSHIRFSFEQDWITCQCPSCGCRMNKMLVQVDEVSAMNSEESQQGKVVYPDLPFVRLDGQLRTDWKPKLQDQPKSNV